MTLRSITLALVLFVTSAANGFADRPKKLLLVGQGPDGHPPQTHEYVAGMRILGKLLQPVGGLELLTTRADEPWKEGPELLERVDGVVLFVSEGGRWMQHDAARMQALEKLAKRGGGIVVLHWAMGTKDAKNIPGCLRLTGGCHGGPDRKYKILETDAQPANAKHPIAAGLKPFRAKDEFYYQLKFVEPKDAVQPVLNVTIDGKPETVSWAWERKDGGRSFGFSGLHYHDNWRLPEYRRLVTQGVLWTLRLPIPKDGVDVSIAEEELKVK